MIRGIRGFPEIRGVRFQGHEERYLQLENQVVVDRDGGFTERRGKVDSDRGSGPRLRIPDSCEIADGIGCQAAGPPSAAGDDLYRRHHRAFGVVFIQDRQRHRHRGDILAFREVLGCR